MFKLENGERWGDVATPDQFADMRALCDGPVRRHFWLRARGRSKTGDAAGATLAKMIVGDLTSSDEIISAAAGRDQAALLIRKIRGIVERTEEITSAVEVVQHKVTVKRSGATLEVISSDVASSWGRTPRWLFVDEIANHDRTQSAQDFVDALLTALIKRRDSRCIIASTPSSPTHWSYKLWQVALDDPLWRASLTKDPAPWQDPDELSAEKRRLTESLYRRLFLCEWAEADDALADAKAIDECLRHEDDLPPQVGVEYVVSFDLSVSGDYTAVVVAHLEDRATVVVDRLRTWKPSKKDNTDMAEVEAYIDEVAREYNYAMIVGDAYQAVAMIQRLRDRHRIRSATFSTQSNSRRAQQLLRVIKDRALDLPVDQELKQEFLSLRLVEGNSPGLMKLTTDGSSGGHYDRATAVMLAIEELLGRPGQDWSAAYGGVYCLSCRTCYLATLNLRCPNCGATETAPGLVPEEALELR